VIVIDPVIRVRRTAEFTAWPVAAPPVESLLPLSAQLTAPEVGTAMAVIAQASRAVPGSENDAVQILRNLANARGLIAPGGLRARDTAKDLEITPSCCCGLEAWREWREVVDGGAVWLGHDPTPWIEQLGPTIRIWPDDSTPLQTAGESAIEIALTDLAELIDAAEVQMKGFLEQVRSWAVGLHHPEVEHLVAALDRSFHITG
jgi:hypothetical protein